MKFSDIEGKTIKRAVQMNASMFDDKGWLKLEFTDGEQCLIIAGYGGYTGKSFDEYGTTISIEKEETEMKLNELQEKKK